MVANKSKKVTVAMTETMYADLQKYAEEQGLKVTEMARKAINTYLAFLRQKEVKNSNAGKV